MTTQRGLHDPAQAAPCPLMAPSHAGTARRRSRRGGAADELQRRLRRATAGLQASQARRAAAPPAASRRCDRYRCRPAPRAAAAGRSHMPGKRCALADSAIASASRSLLPRRASRTCRRSGGGG